jgi:hypothetical protein
MPTVRPSLEPWLGLSLAEAPLAPLKQAPRASPDALRATLYASCRYLLRAILAGVDGAGGDVVDAVILTTIMDANIGYLDDNPALTWRHATYAAGPPEGYRRPITVSALAERLGLAYETTRRRVDGLIAQGRCVRTEHGIHARLLDEPRHHAGSQANYAAVRTLLRDLQTRAPEIGWPMAEAAEAKTEDPPLRLVNRRCAVFAIDTLRRFADLSGGYGEALVYMGVVEATGRGATDDVWPSLRTSSLARSLNQPIPSIRRRVQTLMARGLVTAQGSGFDARPAAAMEPEVSRLAVANLKRLYELFRQLEALGVALATDARQAPAARQAFEGPR